MIHHNKKVSSNMAAVSSVPSVVLLLLFLSSASAASIFDMIGSSVSSLVVTQEEAPYKLIREAEGYEERLYSSQKWVCKQHTGSLSSEAQQQAFLALFDYLEGENNSTTTMDMATPVSIRAPGSPQAREYEACFYPGKDVQKFTPAPNNADLYIRHRPELKVFTRKFGGFADTEKEWRSETAELKNLLDANNEPSLHEHYYWNAFDSPIKFWSRRNEVWILKQ